MREELMVTIEGDYRAAGIRWCGHQWLEVLLRRLCIPGYMSAMLPFNGIVIIFGVGRLKLCVACIVQWPV